MMASSAGTSVFALLFASVVSLAGARAAWANLGGTSESVETDRKALGGELRISHMSTYSVHEISTSSRKVREYVGPNGTVFAVIWQGRAAPDLAALLGTHYDEYQAALNTGHPRVRGARITRSEHLVVEESGHMRDVRGKAYLPGQLPPGVSVAEVR